MIYVNNTIVEVGGVKFTMPDNFKEDVSLRVENSYNDFENFYKKVFYNNANDTITIKVSSFKGIEFDKEKNYYIQKVAERYNLDEKTINGINGYIGEDIEKIPGFVYIHLKRFIMIISNKEDFFDDVVMKNNEEDFDKLPPVEYERKINVGKLICGIVFLIIILFIIYKNSIGPVVSGSTGNDGALLCICLFLLAYDLYFLYKLIKG